MMTFDSSFSSALIASVPIFLYLFIRNIDNQHQQCKKNKYHKSSSQIISLDVRPHIQNSLCPLS